MSQMVIVWVLVAGCAAWIGWQGYRFFRPAPGAKACGGGCGCDAMKKPAQVGGEEGAKAAAGPPKQRVMMISSADLRARIQARRT